MFVEFVEFVKELAVGGGVVHFFEEGGVCSAEGLEHGYAAAAEGLGLVYLLAAYYVDSVVGGLGRGVIQGCCVQICPIVVLQADALVGD